MREREEQKQKEEEAAASEAAATQQAEMPSWQPPADEVLHGYIEEVQNTIQPLGSSREQVDALARLVEKDLWTDRGESTRVVIQTQRKYCVLKNFKQCRLPSSTETTELFIVLAYIGLSVIRWVGP